MSKNPIFKNMFRQANTVSLEQIFKYYHLNISENNRKMSCPFKFHQNGREKTASFYFYPETNSFWCFGCKTGTYPVDFVAGYEDCTRVDAARKILDIFNCIEFDESEEEKENLTAELFQFCSYIRDVRFKYNSEKLSLFIESINENFDDLYNKYNLQDNPNGLKSLMEKTKNKIDNFILENNICHMQLF